MDSNNIIHFQELKETALTASRSSKISLLLEPSTGFIYPIRQDDYRWQYTNEDTTIRIQEREMIYLTDELASWVLSREECGFLSCPETGETVLIPANFLIGRVNSWAEGTLSDPRVSRVHGTISTDAHDYIFTTSPVPTKNGTFLNRRMMAAGESVKLKEGDVIRAGKYHLTFHSVPLIHKDYEEMSPDE